MDDNLVLPFLIEQGSCKGRDNEVLTKLICGSGNRPASLWLATGHQRPEKDLGKMVRQSGIPSASFRKTMELP